jgi:hypothetical protein
MVCDLFELKQNLAKMNSKHSSTGTVILDEYGFAYSADCRPLTTRRQSHNQTLAGTIED